MNGEAARGPLPARSAGHLELAPALPEVTCSKDFIQQILLNLILNAAESMDKHKQVVLGHAAAGQAARKPGAGPGAGGPLCGRLRSGLRLRHLARQPAPHL